MSNPIAKQFVHDIQALKSFVFVETEALNQGPLEKLVKIKLNESLQTSITRMFFNTNDG